MIRAGPGGYLVYSQHHPDEPEPTEYADAVTFYTTEQVNADGDRLLGASPLDLFGDNMGEDYDEDYFAGMFLAAKIDYCNQEYHPREGMIALITGELDDSERVKFLMYSQERGLEEDEVYINDFTELLMELSVPESGG